MEASFININKDHMDPDNFRRISSSEEMSRVPDENVLDEALVKELEERKAGVEINNDTFLDNEIMDKPKTFIREFIIEEKKRIRSLQMKGMKVSQSVPILKKTPRSQKGKCYTCYPRKKVLEHIIQNKNGVTFHHDMCTRNMIIVTPNNHYSTFNDIPVDEIGTIFREIDLFCRGWNICDYNVNYNQGDWQTHKHFHLKIKTYDKTIKRMKGDHFKMVALEKKYKDGVV